MTRRKKWEEWKRRQVEGSPPSERKWVREMLDGVPMPTPEKEIRIREIHDIVERVFGKPPKRRKRRGQ